MPKKVSLQYCKHFNPIWPNIKIKKEGKLLKLHFGVLEGYIYARDEETPYLSVLGANDLALDIKNDSLITQIGVFVKQ